MNEQILLDYEPLKWLVEQAYEKVVEQNAKLFAPPTIDFEKVVRTEYRERMTENLSKRDELQQAFEKLTRDFQTVKQAYERAVAVLEPVERNYCYHRYILAMSNRNIATSFRCSLDKIFQVRQGVLSKIKDL